jgi:hypothetical protein
MAGMPLSERCHVSGSTFGGSEPWSLQPKGRKMLNATPNAQMERKELGKQNGSRASFDVISWSFNYHWWAISNDVSPHSTLSIK